VIDAPPIRAVFFTGDPQLPLHENPSSTRLVVVVPS
jgi:hypothetical protein